MINRVCSLLRTTIPKVSDKGLLTGSGYEVPLDGAVGWQKGAIFQKTQCEDLALVFVNIGDYNSCIFRQVLLYDPN